MTEDGLSGIVVGIGEKMSQLELARFPSDDHRGPGLVVINDVDRQTHTRSHYLFHPVYTIQPVVEPVVKPVGQLVGCLFTRCTGCSAG